MARACAIAAAALAAFQAVAADRVLYIPGWHRCGRGEDAAFRAVCAVFPGAEVRVRDWDGNGRWRKAKANADAEARLLADELAALPAERRESLAVVGHSLGGRMAVRALSELAKRGLKVGRAVVLAAAMPSDDAALADFALASVEPAVFVHNPRDPMLKYCYRLFGGEGARAAGARGPERSMANCATSVLGADDIMRARVDAAWAKFRMFRMIAQHYAPFCLENAKRSITR